MLVEINRYIRCMVLRSEHSARVCCCLPEKQEYNLKTTYVYACMPCTAMAECEWTILRLLWLGGEQLVPGPRCPLICAPQTVKWDLNGVETQGKSHDLVREFLAKQVLQLLAIITAPMLSIYFLGSLFLWLTSRSTVRMKHRAVHWIYKHTSTYHCKNLHLIKTFSTHYLARSLIFLKQVLVWKLYFNRLPIQLHFCGVSQRGHIGEFLENPLKSFELHWKQVKCFPLFHENKIFKAL